MANTLFTNVRIFDGSGDQPFAGEVLVQGNRIARVTRNVGQRAFVARIVCFGSDRDRRRRQYVDAGHGRGAHAFFVERPAVARLDPAHADRRAHSLVRARGRALSVDGLDVVRRCCNREAAARRRDPQRDQCRRNSWTALHRGEPGTDGARRPGRQHAAASAATRVQLRCGGQRARRGTPLRAPVRQVRRRSDQDQSVGRIHRRACRPSTRHFRKKRLRCA